jgi:hypothetical protein
MFLSPVPVEDHWNTFGEEVRVIDAPVDVAPPEI